MKVIIRCDGGKDIGMGHVMRMLVLACEMKKHNSEVIFLCKSDENETYRAGIEKIRECNFQVEEISVENIVDRIVEFQKKIEADLLITDSYDVDELYFNKLKPCFKYTCYMDDMNGFYMNVDFIINQNINAMDMNYSKTTNKSTKLLLGTQYCLIRDEFKKASSEKKKKDFVSDILLTLGGMDEDNNTMKVLELIKDIGINVHVVLGKAFNKNVVDDVYNMANKYKNIYPYKNAIMSELMKKCDIAISACGSTIYELCVMKVPTIGIVIADNQKDTAEILNKRNIIADKIDIDDLKSDKFTDTVNKLVCNKDLRTEISNIQEKVVNVNGSEELCKMIDGFCNDIMEFNK